VKCVHGIKCEKVGKSLSKFLSPQTVLGGLSSSLVSSTQQSSTSTWGSSTSTSTQYNKTVN